MLHIHKKNTIQFRRVQNKGAAMLLVSLLFVVVSTLMIVGFTVPIVNEFTASRDMLHSKKSYFNAESGNEDAYYRLKNSMQTSSPWEIDLNGGTTTVSVVDLADSKEVTSTGEVNLLYRKTRMDISTSITGADFFYGAQIGAGGLELAPNTTVEGVGASAGNVYSNGPIVGAGSSSSIITGDAIVGTSVSESLTAQSTVCNADRNVGKTEPNIDYAQSFVSPDSDSLAKIGVYIKKSGNPSSIPVHIVTDNGGEPGTTSLAEGTLDKNLVGTSYGWVEVFFPTPPSLSSGSTYWIVLDASKNNSKYWIWCADTANGYASGSQTSGTDWTSGPWSGVAGEDMNFRVYYGTGMSSITDTRVEGTAKANTLTDSWIGADAYYQNISGTTVVGTPYPGSTDPTPLAMPISDANIQSWRDDAFAGGVVSGSCPGAPGCSDAMGPVKIEGDLAPAGGDVFTVEGVIHITGNFLPENNSEVRCTAAYGAESCMIVVDGWVDISNNVLFSGSGNSESFVMVLSTLANCLGGAQTGSCGPNNSAVYVANNALGVIFYTTDSLIYLSNNVNITSAVGYKLYLNNNSSISYEIGLADLDFSSGPGGGWKINSWREVE